MYIYDTRKHEPLITDLYATVFGSVTVEPVLHAAEVTKSGELVRRVCNKRNKPASPLKPMSLMRSTACPASRDCVLDIRVWKKLPYEVGSSLDS